MRPRRDHAHNPSGTRQATRRGVAVVALLSLAVAAGGGLPQRAAATPGPLAPGYIETVAGNGIACETPTDPCGDGGPAISATLGPTGSGVAADTVGNLYFADNVNYRVRKVATDGTITTIAGTGVRCLVWEGMDCGDGGPATSALLAGPTDVAFGPTGEMYIADTSANQVRKIDAVGVITTVAGSGEFCHPVGPCGDGGPATEAKLQPNSLAFDSAGNLYIAEQGRNRVWKVDTTGTITTFAGQVGQSCLTYATDQCGDGGPATAATLGSPGSVGVDSHDRVLIRDSSVRVIRRVDTDGVITTIAGNGTWASANIGDGGPATAVGLQELGDLTLGPDDEIYFGSGRHQVRQIDANGILSTVVGTGASCTPTTASCGDGGPALNATVQQVSGLAVDDAGNLFMKDSGAYRVRRVVATSTGGLRGQLIAGPGYTPLGGVVVTVLANWPAWTPVASATTDPAGRWSVSGLGPGAYRFRYFDPQGRIARTWYPQAPTYKTAGQVWVSAGASNPYDEHLPLDAGAKITGQVTDDTGAPVPGTRVYLITADGYVAATTTGAAGHYLIGRIPPGDYWVYFRHPGTGAASWHPAADTRADAAAVVVPAGTTAVADGTIS